ncbi:ferredoxin [Streptosporangium sandarakinum]|uniref:Ferredoxin n=2 Tax=Streptosporangium TaxID=2000 RepID=A0A852V1Y5_9ACTN|nr:MULTISPECIES: ferredoxin [Streptosporangium]NYF42489.1 ferredoxin [Streptosporangium sandarakinum]GGQ02006.1 ferredoxin [Streptosporangium pseudovulgare]
MRITVDYLVCEANAVCTGLAPEVFELDDDDQLHVLLPEPPAELSDRVRHAARSCPKAAISLKES